MILAKDTEKELVKMAIQTIDTVFVGEQAFPVGTTDTITNQIAFTAHVPSGVVPTLQVFTNIQHIFDDDLDVSLTNPNGTSIDLFTDVGSGRDGFFINLSDAALTDIGTVNILGDEPITGTFNPEGTALL